MQVCVCACVRACVCVCMSVCWHGCMKTGLLQFSLMASAATIVTWENTHPQMLILHGSSTDAHCI